MERLLTFIVICSLSCQTLEKKDLIRPPEKLNDGIKVDSPLSYNASMHLLDSMILGVNRGDFVNIHSILIMKEGKLILEEYFDKNERHTSHEIRSATKSIGSVLTGIAIDQGFIPSADSYVYEFLAEDYSPAYGWEPDASKIKISHLLSMMSGYECDDLGTNFACENAMHATDDWVQYSLDLPIAFKPGENWAYNSSSLILVGEIIARTAGMDLDDFAKKYLFNPLGINSFQWLKSPSGKAWIGGGAMMIPRDMAKIGSLMLEKGKWNGNTILSEVV